MHRLGGLAQLARAFDWQSKGQRFDSAILHKKDLRRLRASTAGAFLFISIIYDRNISIIKIIINIAKTSTSRSNWGMKMLKL